MNAVAKIKPDVEITEAEPLEGLALLRAPFPPHQISKLPKPLAKREEMDKLPKANCAVCGGYHATSKILHLDYVGHAALTDRLLDADPNWTWEPVAFRDGLPAFDQTGGLWIKLTVCGVTRLGYGHAAAKPQMDAGSREKEVIGDALRNAAMRFGAALDLWHKGELHAEPEEPLASAEELAINTLQLAKTKEAFKAAWEKNKDGWRKVLGDEAYARVVDVMKQRAAIFTRTPSLEARAPKEPEPDLKTLHAAAENDFGIGDDEIPF